jgi:uridine kinase
MTRPKCLANIAEAVDSIGVDHPTRVAIDGVDGAGKTTFADELADCLQTRGRNVIRASIDGFHRRRGERYRRGPDSPEGYFLDSFDHQAIRADLLVPLGQGGDRRYRPAVFDHRLDRPITTAKLMADRRAVLVMDGVFLQRPEMEGLWDFVIWVDVQFRVSVERAVSRDAALGGDDSLIRRRYEIRYVPGQRLYLDTCRPLERADAVVGNTDIERPTLTLRHPG